MDVTRRRGRLRKMVDGFHQKKIDQHRTAKSQEEASVDNNGDNRWTS
jgi:hypothetical protein